MFKKLSFLALALCSAQAAVAQYKAIDLTPPASDLQMRVGQDAWAEGNGNAFGVQVGAGTNASSSTSVFRQAAMWLSTNPSMILLAPLVYSEAYGTDGIQEVGFTQDPNRAALWTGSAASFVDLHPLGYIASRANACSAGIQSGWGLTPPTIQGFPSTSSDDNRFTLVQGGFHALKWSGTAASVVDLNPADYDASISWGTENGVQVGAGVRSDDGVTRGLRWLGTPESFVDISPVTDWANNPTIAYGIHGGQTVGSCGAYGEQHAAIWNGPTGADMIDVHPAGFSRSLIRGTNGVQQVGFGRTGAGLDFGLTADHAILWTGTADSAVDLHQFIPQGWRNSYATSIAEDGTITVIAYDYQTGAQPDTNQLSTSGGTLITHTFLLVPTDTPACAVASVSVDQASVSVTIDSADGLLDFAFPVNGIVTLTSPAPVGGAVVRLLNPYFNGRETTVTVPEGATTATFDAGDRVKLAYPSDINFQQVISASYGGVTKDARYITLGPDQHFIFPGEVRQGLVGMIMLAHPVDADEYVPLFSSDSTLVQVPPKILLRKGMAFATYPYTVTPSLVTTTVGVGGTCSKGSFLGSLVVHAFSRPVASLTSIAPSAVISGQPVTITLTGNTFDDAAQVLVGGSPVPTHFVSPTTLTADVPASATPTAAQFSVTVQNPKAFQSNAATLTAVGPTLGSISPSTVVAGTTFTATLSGTNFAPGAQVFVSGGPTVLTATFVSAKQLSVVIPGSAIPAAGTMQVWVRNPNSSTDSLAVNLNLQNPKPVISSLSPSTVAVGSPGVTITVSGTGFVPTSQAFLAGKSMATTYISPTQLQVTIPAASLAKKANLSINVQNPSPGGGGSNGVTLTIS